MKICDAAESGVRMNKWFLVGGIVGFLPSLAVILVNMGLVCVFDFACPFLLPIKFTQSKALVTVSIT